MHSQNQCGWSRNYETFLNVFTADVFLWWEYYKITFYNYLKRIVFGKVD